MSLRRIAFTLAALLVCLATAVPAQTLSRRPATTVAVPSAAPPDAPEGACPPGFFFSQNSSQTVEDFLGVSCSLQPPNPSYHLGNSWWRSYRPAEEFGVLGPIQICAIEFGVEIASTPGAVGQPITFIVGVTLDGPFPGGFRLVLGSVNATLPDLTNQIFTVPVNIQVPSGAEVFIEVRVPDGVPAEHILFPGANDDPEDAPSYISSSDCDINEPVTLADIGFPDSHLIINFRGTEIPMLPTAVVFDGDPNYVVDVGDTTTMGTVWTNFFGGPQDATSTFASVHAAGALTKGLPDTTASYGTMTPGVPTSCESTGDCPELMLGGIRTQGVDEDVFVAETLTLPALREAPLIGPYPDKIWEVHVGGSFADVPAINIFYAFIENIFHNGVTGGCGGVNYCPGNATLRKQMAVFLLKALLGSTYVPPAATGIFDDVLADAFQPWIEDLYNRGITGGCAGGPPPAPISYCPEQPVRRKQMAVFLLKTKEGSAYVPPPATGIFDDVPADGFQAWIEDLYNRGITGGCAGGPPPAPISYCPENAVTRGQMAPFLVKTFLLLLYGP